MSISNQQKYANNALFTQENVPTQHAPLPDPLGSDNANSSHASDETGSSQFLAALFSDFDQAGHGQEVSPEMQGDDNARSELGNLASNSDLKGLSLAALIRPLAGDDEAHQQQGDLEVPETTHSNDLAPEAQTMHGLDLASTLVPIGLADLPEQAQQHTPFFG